MTLEKALNEINIYQFRTESSYPTGDAQRNLAGRTHYASDNTLKYFKARILRGHHSSNGLFYILQESLPHPDFDMKRIRRNVVFDVFGSVVGAWREDCHTSAIKADKAYTLAKAWADSIHGAEHTAQALQAHIKRQDTNLFNAQQALNEIRLTEEA